MLYHASAVGGLTTLEPRVSTHGRAYVYAVRNPVIALLFGVKHDDFDFCISGQEKPVICECYPNAFLEKYQGKQCSLYELPEDGFQAGRTSWSAELVSETSAEVVREMQINDMYAVLLDYARLGQLTIQYFEDSPAYRTMIEAHITDRLLRFKVDLNACLDWPDDRFRKHFAHLVRALKNGGGAET